MQSTLNLPTLVADPTAETEALDSFDADEAPDKLFREVKTLHEPPEIWDLVPEAPKRFNRSSALLVRFTSINPLLLALIVVIGGGGSVFGYINWGNWSGAIRGVSSLLKDPGGNTSSSLRSTVPEKRAADSEQPRTDSRDVAPGTMKTNVAITGVEPKPRIAENPVASVNPTAAQVAALPLPVKSVTKTPRPSKTNSEPALARALSKPQSQSSETPAPADDGGRATSTAAKHADEKTQGTQLSAPAKATSTPKGKVIQWP